MFVEGVSVVVAILCGDLKWCASIASQLVPREEWVASQIVTRVGRCPDCDKSGSLARLLQDWVASLIVTRVGR